LNIVNLFIVLFIIFVCLEIFEVSWQKEETFYGLIEKNYLIYKKNIFLYFAFNPSFIYVLFLAIFLNNFSFFMDIFVLLKFIDISYRLSLMKKLDKGLSLEEVFPIDLQMTFWFRYLSFIIYGLLFVFAYFA